MENQMLVNISRQLDELTALLTKENIPKRAKAGRPNKRHIVFQFRDKYPNSSKSQCVRITKLSIKTVSKYWDEWEAQWKNEENQKVQSEQAQMKQVKQVQGK